MKIVPSNGIQGRDSHVASAARMRFGVGPTNEIEAGVVGVL